MSTKQKVMIREATFEDCKDAVNEAFDLFRLPLKGKRVAIKPNLVHRRTPDKQVTTHPAVLSAVVERVEKEGAAAIWVGDNVGLNEYGFNRNTFDVCGLYDACRGHYVNFGVHGEVRPWPMAPGKVIVSPHIMQADVYISVPKFKTHGLTLISCGIKNNFGVVTGGCKGVLHQGAGDIGPIQDMIVNSFFLRPPDLCIVDGIVGMSGQGPLKGILRPDVKSILASDNALALDATVARMMGMDPYSVPIIRKVAERGYGSIEEKDIEIDGTFRVLPDWEPAVMISHGYNAIPEARIWMDEQLARRPAVNRDMCTGCGVCSFACPLDCLPMRDGYPVVDAEACLHCNVCEEICPHRAISFA